MSFENSTNKQTYLPHANPTLYFHFVHAPQLRAAY